RLIVGNITFKTNMLITEAIEAFASINASLTSRSSTYDVSNQSKSEYSLTNTQVEDVDEADIVKTDGKYVYYLEGSFLYIVEAYPTDEMKIVYKCDFSKEGRIPVELF